MDLRDRITTFLRALPVAQRVTMATALVVLALAGVVFVRWLSAPTYSVLYSGMDDAAVSGVITELDGLGVPYRLEGGGSRVLVPRDRLYETRASLAAAGVGGRTAPAGYELLDEQGLSISDFRQRVDYQRAVEGELAKTLMAMEGVSAATVHLALPEEELFTEQQKPATASVMLTTTRPLNHGEVEAVTFLVASSVEGLEPTQITVADAKGGVLHAPGDGGGSSSVTNRQMRQTREFEQALAADVQQLLSRASDGGPVSVVVRATLDFDETETERETFDPESQVTLKEQVSAEEYEGTGPPPGGTVGVDGGPIADQAAAESAYQREEETREYGVDRETTRTISAPGRVERLSVAVVMDDGSKTLANVPSAAQVEDLVSAALQLDDERGDSVAVTRMPMAPAEEVEAEPTGGLLDRLPELVALLVVLLVGLALFLMARRGGRSAEPLPAAVVATPLPEPVAELPADQTRKIELDPEVASLQRDVTELVQSQPEEIATLLRGWLADRRGA